MVSRQFELPLRYQLTTGQDQAAYKSGSEGEGFSLRVNNGNNGGQNLCPALFAVDAVIHSVTFTVITRSATNGALDDSADWKLVIERVDGLTSLDPANATTLGAGTRLWASRTLTSGGTAGLIYPNAPMLTNQKINLRVTAGSILNFFIERQGSVSDRNIAVSATFDISYDVKGLKQRNFVKKSAFFVIHGGDTTRSTTTYNAISLRMGAIDPAPLDPVATTNEVYCPFMLRFAAKLTRLRWAVMCTAVETFTFTIRASKTDHALASTPYGTGKIIHTARTVASVAGQWVVSSLESPNLIIPQFYESGAYARPQLFAVATPNSTGAKFNVITWLEFERT